jgi:two-component system nitrogen regulation sensor histidine kinase GlnL
VIRCTDNGPGVPDEIRSRVFDSFTSHGKPDGTGLGLAIVRKVVADHGGTVELKSQPGETVFTLVLPQDRFKESIAPPAGPEERQVQA